MRWDVKQEEIIHLLTKEPPLYFTTQRQPVLRFFESVPTYSGLGWQMKILTNAVLVTCIFIIQACSSQLTDDRLSELLIDTKSQLEQLVAISSACLDRESRILWANDSKGGGAQCREIMREIGIEGMSKDHSGSISFYVADGKYSSHQKGLIFSQTRMLPTFDSLDRKPPGIHRYERAYKLVQENWYIYYEYDN